MYKTIPSEQVVCQKTKIRRKLREETKPLTAEYNPQVSLYILKLLTYLWYYFVYS